MSNSIFKFEFDQRVRDTVTGWEGTVTARTEWRNGCIRYSVETLSDREIKEYVFDEDRLDLVEDVEETREFSRRTGGGRPTPARTGL